MHAHRRTVWAPEKNRAMENTQITCFNARITFLNNLSDGLTNKKQRENVSERELPPSGRSPKPSTNEYSITSPEDYTNNTMSTCMSNTTMGSHSTVDSTDENNVDLKSRVNKWYVSLNNQDNDDNDDDLCALKEGLEIGGNNKQLNRIRKIKNGNSLKLQNGSYPITIKKQDKNENKQNKQITDNNNLEVPSDKSDTLSDNYDPLSDKCDDPFSRTSSAMSNLSSSLYSPKTSVVSLDSSFSTSEYSSIRNSTMASNDDLIELERERLKTVLDNIDPKLLKEQLKKCLASNKPSLTKSLRALLPKNKFTGHTTHCLRCHKGYDRRYGDKTCILRHPKSDVMIVSEDDKSAVFQCDRCACVFKLEGTFEYNEQHIDISHCGACYIGTHTEYTSEIEYEPNGFAKTCSEQGCAIFYV